MTSSPTSLPSDLLDKLTKLSDICEHVRDISRKIADLQDDPLPGQLERSVPSYASLLTSHTAMLKRRHWMFIVAGDSEMIKAAFVDFLLRQPSDIDLRHVLTQCLAHSPVAVCHGERTHYVVCLDALCDPVVLENWQAVEELIRTSSSGVSWITVHLPSELLEKDMDLVIYPDKIGDSSIARLMDVLTNSDVIIYVADAFNLDSTEKFQMFASEMRASRQLHQASFALTNCCMTVLLSNVQACSQTTLVSNCAKTISYEADQDLQVTSHFMQKLKKNNEDSQKGSRVSEMTVSLLNDTGTTAGDSETQSGGKTLDLATLLSAMNQTLNRSVESRLTYHFEWLNSFVGRVLYHLKAFLNQAEQSHDERLEKYRNIIARLTALTDRSEAFLKALEMEVDTQYKEGVSLLRNHLLNEDVIQRLSTWSEDEAPDDELWQETDALITRRIQNRIRHELLLWERDNRFFQTQRPRLIELFEIRFRGIKTHLTSVETMISHRRESSTSSNHVIDVEPSPATDVSGSTSGDQGTFPFAGVRLNWTQKLVIGLAAPVLVPLAVAAALLGLPILGGLAARDLVAERRSEVKSREYRLDKLKYLAVQTADDVRTFANSSALDDYVVGELRTAFHCIGQLREEVPQQIEAHRAQISALRDDDRQMNDLERFYRPLVEVFEHSRLLLVVFRLLHLRRERLDVEFAELNVDPRAPVVCDSLTGTVAPASWTRRHPVSTRTHAAVDGPTTGDRKTATTAVALKRLTRRLDTRNIEDYVLEEEAYRFQACPSIARLLATSKHAGIIYHVLEPLQCSLRQHLESKPDHNRPADTYTGLRSLLIQLLRGLDYLHDRGWVHFDLTLDSIGVDMVGKVKLTNISCRQLVSVPDEFTSSPVAVETLLRYTHLPPEVLARPPAAYTPAGEMYSVGTAMYEMWTRQRGAHWRHLVNRTEPIIDSFEKLVDLMRTVRPNADRIISTTPPNAEVNTRSSTKSERIERVWSDWTLRCWREEERISCKAMLQLVEAESGMPVIDGGAMLPMNERHYQEE